MHMSSTLKKALPSKRGGLFTDYRIEFDLVFLFLKMIINIIVVLIIIPAYGKIRGTLIILSKVKTSINPHIIKNTERIFLTTSNYSSFKLMFINLLEL
jgi:hypothetical protein